MEFVIGAVVGAVITVLSPKVFAYIVAKLKP